MKKCNYCKRKYQPVRIKQKYCEYACKMAAYWVKKARKVKK